MRYTVNNIQLGYAATGEKMWGQQATLLKNDLDLTAKTDWSAQGYTIEKLFDPALYNRLKDNTHNLLLNLWREALLPIPKDFQPERYHEIATSKEIHLAAVEKTKLIDVSRFPINISLLEQRISEICGEDLEVRNPFDGQTVFHFRVIRPNQNDNNPLHRDVWLEDYKDCINLYIPVAGSNEKSSLIIAPGTHHWPEADIERTSRGAEINGVKYNVPALTDSIRPINFVRPNPGENEVLVFSPYLIHGGSSNLNDNITRVSIEVRLWKKDLRTPNSVLFNHKLI